MRIQPFSIGGPLIGSTCLARSVIVVVEERISVTERCFPGRLKGWAESRASCPWKKSSSCDPARYSDRPYSSVAPMILGSSAESVGKKPVRTGLCPEPRGFGRHGTGMLMLPFGRIPKKSCVPSLSCKFSHVAASFPTCRFRQDGNLVATRDKMKSCRHKRHDGILSPQETQRDLVTRRNTRESCLLWRHRHLIPNWFRAGGVISSDVVEGLNGKAKLTCRKAYGETTPQGITIALFHPMGVTLHELEISHRFFWDG